MHFIKVPGPGQTKVYQPRPHLEIQPVFEARTVGQYRHFHRVCKGIFDVGWSRCCPRLASIGLILDLSAQSRDISELEKDESNCDITKST